MNKTWYDWHDKNVSSIDFNIARKLRLKSKKENLKIHVEHNSYFEYLFSLQSRYFDPFWWWETLKWFPIRRDWILACFCNLAMMSQPSPLFQNILDSDLRRTIARKMKFNFFPATGCEIFFDFFLPISCHRTLATGINKEKINWRFTFIDSKWSVNEFPITFDPRKTPDD